MVFFFSEPILFALRILFFVVVRCLYSSYFIVTYIVNMTNDNGNVMLSGKYWLLIVGKLQLLEGAHIKHERNLA